MKHKRRTDWKTAPIVFIAAPICPGCGSPRYLTIRSEAGGDGSRSRLARCSACDLPFKICVEFPEFGNSVSPIGMMRAKAKEPFQ